MSNDKSSELALYQAPSVDEATQGQGDSFFRRAYAIVCAKDRGRPQRDREILQGALIQIATEYGHDVGLAAGQQASIRLMGAFLTLGLEEAAEGDEAAAVEFLELESLSAFITIALSMHDELRKKVNATLRRGVLECDSGLYGLLEPAHEAELVQLAKMTTIFATREELQAAREPLTRAEDILVLAKHLPLKLMMVSGGHPVAFQAMAYQRKNADTPNPKGSIFALFLRSYMVTSMTTTDPMWQPPVLGGMSQAALFVSRNLVANTDRARALIADLFFEPEKLLTPVKEALEAVEALFRGKIVVHNDQGGWFESQPLKRRDLKDLVARVAGGVFKDLVAAVREYFKTAANVSVSPEDMTLFWYPRLLLRVGASTSGIICDDHRDRLMLISAESMGGAIKDLPTLLRLPIDQIARYVEAGYENWSPELRKALLEQYEWNQFFEKTMDEVIIHDLAILVTHLGPTLLHRFNSPKRTTLLFWLRAWNDAKPLREAILLYFEEERFMTRLTPGKLLEAVKSSMGVSNDERLFALLLTRSMRDLPGDKMQRVPAVTIRGALCAAALDNPRICQLIAARVEERVLEQALIGLGDHDQARIRKMIGK